MPAEVRLVDVPGATFEGSGVRRSLWGGAVALVTMAACTGVLLAYRPNLTVATSALVLVVPVLVGVSIGGFTAGVLTAIVGFLVFDWFFVPPSAPSRSGVQRTGWRSRCTSSSSSS